MEQMTAFDVMKRICALGKAAGHQPRMHSLMLNEWMLRDEEEDRGMAFASTRPKPTKQWVAHYGDWIAEADDPLSAALGLYVVVCKALAGRINSELEATRKHLSKLESVSEELCRAYLEQTR